LGHQVGRIELAEGGHAAATQLVVPGRILALTGSPPRVASWSNGAMDFLMGLLQAIGMLVALAIMIVLVAGLFMIVFQIATGIDDRLNN
jgi:hypothetical protein